MSDHDLLTMEEVAKRTGVTLKTVYRWIEAGELPVSRLGNRIYRIFERDFIDFIYSKQVNKPQKTGQSSQTDGRVQI